MAKQPYFYWFYLVSIVFFSTCYNERMEVLIQFDTDGGTEIASQNILYNALINPVEPPEKEGYSFKGWFFDQEFTRAFDLEKTIEEQCSYTDTITLYAKFLPRLYRVTYDGNGNTEGEVPVDNNFYAEGDIASVKWNYLLKN